jgi:hypothetical protein
VDLILSGALEFDDAWEIKKFEEEDFGMYQGQVNGEGKPHGIGRWDSYFGNIYEG